MSQVAKAAQPQLRGLLQSQIKKNLILAIGLSFAAAAGLKVLVNDPRKKAYSDFYKSYNIDKEFEKMRSKGLFDSC